MSEYLEAVSRLNATERPPGDDRHYFYPQNIHKYDNASWYNRVMNETGMTKVPKYSIEQRLESEKAFMTANNRKYFNLDPSFTFAQGTRKSIGLRGISVTDKFVGLPICLTLAIEYKDAENVDEENPMIDISATVIPTEENNMFELLNYFQEELTNSLRLRTGDKSSYITVQYIKGRQKIYINIVPDSTSALKGNIIDIYIPNFNKEEKLFYSYFNISPDDVHFRITPDRTATYLYITDAYHGTVKENIVFRASFVDYTTDNYLGETGQDYSLVNKLYNYREQCPQVWIETYDKLGNPVNFDTEEVDGITVGVTYVVELSLICDTNNNILKDY